MATEPQDRYTIDTGLVPSPQQPPTYYTDALTTPLSATSPGFPPSFVDIDADSSTRSSPPSSPMTDESSSLGKGKSKRLPVDMDVSPPLPAQAAGSKRSRPPAPRPVRRHRHRRRNVAASVWGPQLPMAPHNANGAPFNIYKALLRHPNLFFQFAIRLQPTTLTDLYAIDKEFHYRFNKYSVSIIAEHASYHAPEAAYIFSWILFPELCISDPMLRPMDGRPHLARDIPSLRWAKMVVYRDAVVRGILTDMGIQGLRVPRGTQVALMKFWLLLEMKTMAVRTAFLCDKKVWTNDDIFCFLHFLLKLDMRILHPVFANGMCSLSHMMLTQKSLTSLYHLLIGKLTLDYDDATDMLVRTYLTEDLDTDTHPWLEDEIDNGIPEEEWGLLCREGWDMDGERLEPAVDMIMVEAIHRGLNPQQYLLSWTLYGFFDSNKVENITAPRRWRREKKVHVPKETWPLEQVRKGVISKLDAKVEAAPIKTEVNRPTISLLQRRMDGSGSDLMGYAVDMTF